MICQHGCEYIDGTCIYIAAWFDAERRQMPSGCLILQYKMGVSLLDSESSNDAIFGEMDLVNPNELQPNGIQDCDFLQPDYLKHLAYYWGDGCPPVYI